jgi:hypothetical protein
MGVKAGTGVYVGISLAVGMAVAMTGGVHVGGRPMGVTVGGGAAEGPQAERRTGSMVPMKKIFRRICILKPVAPLERGGDPAFQLLPGDIRSWLERLAGHPVAQLRHLPADILCLEQVSLRKDQLENSLIFPGGVKAHMHIERLDESVCYKHTTSEVDMQIKLVIDIVECTMGREFRRDVIDWRALLVEIGLQRVQKQLIV